MLSRMLLKIIYLTLLSSLFINVLVNSSFALTNIAKNLNLVVSDGLTSTVNTNNQICTRKKLNSIPLVFDRKSNNQSSPKRFRSSPNLQIASFDNSPEIAGLKEFNSSGSGQLSADDFKKIYTAIVKLKPDIHIYFIDLRKEFHGFVNEDAVSRHALHNWINYAKTPEMVEQEQALLLNGLKKKKQTTINDITEKKDGEIAKLHKNKVEVKTVRSEEELVKSLGANSNYLRFYVDDHSAPNPEEIDRFIKFIDGLDKLDGKYWLHFHCRGGSGRTSTFMTFTDMLKNADKVSMEDIMNRQKELGGRDLNKTKNDTTKKDAKKNPTIILEAFEKRKAVLEKFYQFAKERLNKTIPKEKSWSEWIATNKK
ncbi:MAG: hypothetical protein HQK49_15810 [Oligoflexia bacterium]|nr:hypothetical protein [Oligoflexia bacterium]